MTAFTWAAPGTSGNWNAAANWNPTGGPPGSVTPDTDTADLTGGTSAYTVTISTSNSFDIATLDIAGGSASHPTTLSISGTLLTDTLDYLGSAVNDALIDINSGGFFDIRKTISGSHRETITITGGTQVLGSSSNSGIGINNTNVTFSLNGTAGGEIEYNGPSFTTGSTAAQVITGATAGDSFVFVGGNFTGDTFTYSGTTLTVKSGSTTVLTMTNLSGQTGLASGDFTVGSSTNTIQIVCFAASTRIRTPDGEKAAESLVPGDVVMTVADGQLSPRPIKWIGRRRIDLTAHPRPEAVAPVCIQRSAFADHVPHNALLLSPDHAIFVDGKLICARQLINGTTIRQEMDLRSIEYFHIELDAHGILLAAGLPVESYLNTGNQGFFANSDEPLVLHPDLTDESDYPTREAGSFAPFAWDEATVRPVWQRLADRAAANGWPVPQRATTTDPDLRLLTVCPGYRTIRPIQSDSNLVAFALPRDIKEVRLVSRAQSATDARPWLEDRRRLGVRVKSILLRGASDLREIPVDHPDLTKGWWAVEHDGHVMSRWTGGDAVLPLPEIAENALLEIHLADAMIYLMEAEVGDTRRMAA